MRHQGGTRPAAALLCLAVVLTAPRATANGTVREEEVFFAASGHTLAGTLTLPATSGPHPAVVLISGSGRQDRDEAIGIPGYLPFRWLAAHLGRQGVAVLRYDDRGVAKSTGDFFSATSADFAQDATAALRYLLRRKEVDARRIGLLGHSEGGLVAPMVAARDPRVAFVIGMAPPGVTGYQVLLVQVERILRSSGASEEQVAQGLLQAREDLNRILAHDWAALEASVHRRALDGLRSLPEAQRREIGDLERAARDLTAELMRFNRIWMPFFLVHNPTRDWARVRVPVLALFGGLDTQVDLNQNRPPIEAALRRARNTDVTITVFPRANHLFQEAVTGSPNEYARLTPAFLPGFLEGISSWLRATLPR